MESNYDRLIEKISSISGLDKKEIELKINEKREKLSGLISKEGAAQIVAAELGISFDQEKFKIGELVPGMRKVNVIGKIINISSIRSFKTKTGKESKVVSLNIADETSNIRVVLWDTNHIELIEKGEISEGSVIEISNATMRDNEIHLGSFSEIKVSDKVLENIITEKKYQEKDISRVKKGESVKVRAFVVQVFEPRIFYFCTNCNKKIEKENCDIHTEIPSEKRVILNVILDDGSSSIRAVFFNEASKLLGLNSIEDKEKNNFLMDSLLGKEMYFFGDVQENALFNNLEIIIDKLEEINIDELLKNLEKVKN
jgi:ssDNA-binding replication factor A large subunit